MIVAADEATWDTVSDEAADLPLLQVHKMRDLPRQPEALFVEARGLDRESLARLRRLPGEAFLEISILPERRQEGDVLDAGDGSGLCQQAGLALPGDGEFSVRHWLRELAALQILLSPPPHSIAGWLSGRDSIALPEQLRSLASQSHREWNDAGESRVRTEAPRHYRVRASAPTQAFSQLQKRALREVDKLHSKFAGQLGNGTQILKNLATELKGGRAGAADILVLGAFSAGKTTFVNQVIIGDRAYRLNTAARPNTAMSFTLRVDGRETAPKMRRQVDESVSHLLLCLADAVPSRNELSKEQRDDVDAAEQEVNNCDDAAKARAYFYGEGNRVLRASRDQPFAWESTPPGMRLSWTLTARTRAVWLDAGGNQSSGRRARRVARTNKVEIRTPEHLIEILEKFPQEPGTPERTFAGVRLVHVPPRESGRLAALEEVLDGIDLRFDVDPEDCSAVVNLDADNGVAHLEAGALPWLRAEIDYTFPSSTRHEWLAKARVVDTPGLGSPYPEHDRVTQARLARSGPGDVWVGVVKVRGGPRSIDDESVQVVKRLIAEAGSRAVVIVGNYDRGRNGEALTVARAQEIESSLQSLLRDAPGRGSQGRAAACFVSDLLDGAIAPRERLQKGLAKLVGDATLGRLAEAHAKLLRDAGDALTRDRREVRNEAERRKLAAEQADAAEALACLSDGQLVDALADVASRDELSALKEWKRWIDAANYDCSRDSVRRIVSTVNALAQDSRRPPLWLQRESVNGRMRVLKGWIRNAFRSVRLEEGGRLRERPMEDTWLVGLPGELGTIYSDHLSVTKASMSLEERGKILASRLGPIVEELEDAGVLKRAWWRVRNSGPRVKWKTCIQLEQDEVRRAVAKLGAEIRAWAERMSSHLSEVADGWQTNIGNAPAPAGKAYARAVRRLEAIGSQLEEFGRKVGRDNE